MEVRGLGYPPSIEVSTYVAFDLVFEIAFPEMGPCLFLFRPCQLPNEIIDIWEGPTLITWWVHIGRAMAGFSGVDWMGVLVLN